MALTELEIQSNSIATMSTIFHKLWNRIPGDPKMKNMAFFIVTRSSVLGVVYYTTRNVPLLKNYSILAIIELVTVAGMQV